MYHVRHRVYRPEWGKWIQRDPLGYAAGWNLYEYVGGEPWRMIDPEGLDGHWLGDKLRKWGFGSGDWVDDLADGAEVIFDTVRQNKGAAATGAKKGLLGGLAIGAGAAALVGASGPAAPVVATVLLIVGTAYLVYTVDQLGEHWNEMTEEEQAEALGNLGGGLVGGMVGPKLLRPNRGPAPSLSKPKQPQTPAPTADCPTPKAPEPYRIGNFERHTTPWAREVYQRNDINWNYRRADGLTNRQAAKQGLAPRRATTGGGEEEVQLHHLNQNPNGTLVEVWRSTHQRIKHNAPRPSWRVTDPAANQAFKREVPDYWRWRVPE